MSTSHDGDHDVRVIAHVPKVSKKKMTKTLLKMSMAKVSSMKRCSIGKKIKLASSMLMEEGQSP